MNKSLEVLKQIYKPYRYTIQGHIVILSTTSGDLVVKQKSENQNVRALYSYLNSRSFTNFPPLVDESRSDVNVYEYIEGISMPQEQKSLDMIDLISGLHNKTTFYRPVTEDTFKEIYDHIKQNIDYLKNYYNQLYEETKKEIYMAPSHYLFMRNAYKIFASLDFCQKELDEWFFIVKEERKKRVSLIHNHLELDHFIKSDKDYLISWEKSRIDSPVMDLVEFYKNSYFQVNFEVLLSRYLEKVKLSEDEKKLFFLLISLPKKIEFSTDEFHSCKNVREALDYLFMTEQLVRPYYTIEQEN